MCSFLLGFTKTIPAWIQRVLLQIRGVHIQILPVLVKVRHRSYCLTVMSWRECHLLSEPHFKGERQQLTYATLFLKGGARICTPCWILLMSWKKRGGRECQRSFLNSPHSTSLTRIVGVGCWTPSWYTRGREWGRQEDQPAWSVFMFIRWVRPLGTLWTLSLLYYWLGEFRALPMSAGKE